jgi:hypothetical protein
MRVEDLKARGARALSTEEIRSLVWGKTLRIIDLRNDEKFEAFFGEDGTRTIVSAISPALGNRSGRPSESTYEIKEGRLHSSWTDGSNFSSQIYDLEGRHFGARSNDMGWACYELLGVLEGRVTIKSLESQGGLALNTQEMKDLFVGKTLTIRHLVTGEVFEISYTEDGIRTVSPTEADPEEVHSTYEIDAGLLKINETGMKFSARIYSLGNQYFGARSQEQGFISYEILSSRGIGTPGEALP